MSIEQLNEDVKALDAKIDQLSIDVAVISTIVKEMPGNLKNSIIVYLLGFFVPVCSGFAAVFFWVTNSYIPALISQLITKGTSA